VDEGEAVLACGRPEAVVRRRARVRPRPATRDGARTGAANLMSSAIGIFARRLGVTVVLVGVAAVLLWLGARSPAARAADPGALAQQISASQNRVSALSGAVGADNGRLRQLDAGIAGLQGKIARIQSDLDAKRAELLQLRRELNAARVRLASLQTYEHRARYVLAQQLVASYETEQPDLVSVVLDSNGFSNLLERLSFAQRIRSHDQQIVAAVILARDRVAAQAVRLGGLEGRQQDVTARVLAERDQLDGAKLTLLNEQMSVTRARDKNVSQLVTARGRIASLRRQLARLQAEQAQQAAQAAASQVTPGEVGTVTPGGNQAGSDPIPGFTIGRDDMGVDATAPPGAGIYAPRASTLVQVLQDWYGSEPLLLFQFDAPPPGAPSDYWYVAEQIDPVTTAVGTSFQAGQRVASYASSGSGIEIGWGSATSDTRTLAGATDPAAASPPAGSTTSWAESFKSVFGIP
jgi:peptidoglycan hydrolase CwlO-like protein